MDKSQAISKITMISFFMMLFVVVIDRVSDLNILANEGLVVIGVLLFSVAFWLTLEVITKLLSAMSNTLKT